MIRRFLGALALACAFAFSCAAPASAAPFVADQAHTCPQFFYAGEKPASAPVVQLCFDGYSLGHDASIRQGRWSAEHMTAADVAAAEKAKREGTFHPEPLLPAADRSELADYRCAPFDRGHETPVGDFGPTDEKQDTFSLANMMPQDPMLNEHLWATLEKVVRGLAARDGEVYVVTGPLFDTAPKMLNGRVAIPVSTWKAVYDPKIGAFAFIAVNDASTKYQTITLAELTDRLGFDPMPGVRGAERAVLPTVTVPTVKPINAPARACKGSDQ
jgi:endonuclease G